MELDYKKTSSEIISWIKDTVKAAGFERLVIAISGGIDSAVSAKLATLAVGSKNIFPILLPYGDMSKNSIQDGELILDFLKIPKENRQLINIKKSVDEMWNTLEKDTSYTLVMATIRKGNIMARVRMIYLFDKAKSLNALVCGTENKSEHLLGYFTRFGDAASDLEPIVNLYKTQVWEMGRFLNLPQKIIDNKPTAGLWENQTDEEEFGFLYKEGDLILNLYFDQKVEINKIIEKGFNEELINKVLLRVRTNAFKNKLPYVI